MGILPQPFPRARGFKQLARAPRYVEVEEAVHYHARTITPPATSHMNACCFSVRDPWLTLVRRLSLVEVGLPGDHPSAATHTRMHTLNEMHQLLYQPVFRQVSRCLVTPQTFSPTRRICHACTEPGPTTAMGSFAGNPRRGSRYLLVGLEQDCGVRKWLPETLGKYPPAC